MSDPAEPIAPAAEPEKTLIEQDGSVPETVVIPDPPAEEPEAPAEPEPASGEAAIEAAPEKPKRTPWYQTRIDALTRQKAEERAAREATEARLALLEAAANPPGDAPKGYTAEDFQAAVRAEAQRVAQVESANKRTKSWLDAGSKEYGLEAFNEKCNTVAAMGAGDSPDFMAIVTDPDVMPEGHKVVAMLADNPDEAERILALEPRKMIAALTRFATTAAAPAKPISQAPRPITQVGGTAKSTAPSEADDIKVWMEKRRADIAARSKTH